MGRGRGGGREDRTLSIESCGYRRARREKRSERINPIRDDIVRSASLARSLARSLRIGELVLPSYTSRQISQSFTRAPPKLDTAPARPIKLRVTVIPGPNTPVYTLQVTL